MQGFHDQKHSVTGEKSVARHEVSRDRLFRQRLKPGEFLDYLMIDYGAYVMGGIVLAGVLFPAVISPLCILFLIVFLFSFSVNKYTDWALHEPVYLMAAEEKSNKKNGFVKPAKSKAAYQKSGLIYIGNDKERNHKALWLNREELVRHMALFGATGSGKTEFLMGLMYQLLLLGSGFTYVDGKADIKNFAKLYSMLKLAGLEDNLLVVNFYTGHSNKKNEKISNTLNPFTYGSSDTLMEILSGLMGGAQGDQGMWRDRAEALGRCLLRALCELRDLGKIELSIETIRENMPLKKLYELMSNVALSKESKNSIQFYFNDLPGWSVYIDSQDIAQSQKAELEVNKQHNFLTMQFTHVLELLAGTYGHITQTDLSEVDFMDVIVNRRILYVMLPSLEKSEESLKNLGRLILSSIRNALSRLLGINSLTGTKEDLLDNKAFNADVPYAMIFDEYGSYCVEGFGTVAAQARSLNTMLIFAGQDYASFKKASEAEAQHVIGNTDIKVFMKTECLETKQLAIDRAGMTYAYMSEDIKRMPESEIENYRDTGAGKLKEINRLQFDDLFSLEPGQCWVTYKNHLWQVKGFYGDFPLSENYRINDFIKLKSTSESGESNEASETSEATETNSADEESEEDEANEIDEIEALIENHESDEAHGKDSVS